MAIWLLTSLTFLVGGTDLAEPVRVYLSVSDPLGGAMTSAFRGSLRSLGDVALSDFGDADFNMQVTARCVEEAACRTIAVSVLVTSARPTWWAELSHPTDRGGQAALRFDASVVRHNLLIWERPNYRGLVDEFIGRLDATCFEQRRIEHRVFLSSRSEELSDYLAILTAETAHLRDEHDRLPCV